MHSVEIKRETPFCTRKRSETYNSTSFYVFDPHKQNTYGLPDSNGGAIVLKFNYFKQLCLYIHELSKSLSSTHYELTPVTITKYKQIR